MECSSFFNAALSHWSLTMQTKYATRRCSTAIYTAFLVMMCCMVLLLSGCADLLAGSVPSDGLTPTPTHPDQSIPGAPKRDASGVPSESILRAQLAKVQKIMAGMSLDQKLGQLIVVEYLGNSYQGSGLQYMITQQFVGGFMYQESNHNFETPYDTINQNASLSRRTMDDARVPLLIATDQEGGQVNRLYTFHGYLPSAEAMAAKGDPHVALDQGTKAAKWMLQLGINADLAPVVDVHTVDPPVLESRMFGSDTKTVALY